MKIDELYENRLLVFLEAEPQSNMYQQVLLNEEQIKKVGDIISIRTPEGDKDMIDGVEAWQIDLSEDKHKLPDLPSIFLKK